MIKTKRLILILAFLLLCAPVLGALDETGYGYSDSVPVGTYLSTGVDVGILYTGGWDSDITYPCYSSTSFSTSYDYNSSICGFGILYPSYWFTTSAICPYSEPNLIYFDITKYDIATNKLIPQLRWYCNGTPAFVDFSYTIKSYQPKTVNFTDISSGFTPSYFFWDYGDGSELYYGTNITNIHTYQNYGNYNVSHTATDFSGNSGWMNKTVSVIPITETGYILSLNPSQINLGDSTNIIVTSNHGFNDVDLITYYSADVINYEYFNSFRSYRKTAGVWERKNLSSEPYVATSDNPFNFGYQPETYGDKQITAYIYNLSGAYPVQYYSLLATPTEILKVITSAQNPLVNMYLYAYDVFTGAHLTNTTLTLIDYTKQGYTRTWDNVPYQQHVVLNAYDSCNLSATKEGYADNYMPFIVPNRTGNLDNPNNPPSFDQFIGVQLIPDYIPSSANNFTMVITAIDSITKQPVPSFKVNIPQFNIIRTSDNQGNQISVLVPYDLAFSATVSATGYQSQTQYTGSFHPLSLKQLVFELVKITPTATPTRTPTPITTFTTRPTPQPTEGGIIVNGSFCQTPTDIVSTVKYFFCTMGFTDASAGIIIACMIMFFFACILGILSQHALGFLVGAMIGFIMSIGLGLIPFWILLGMLGIGILVGILIMMGKSG